MSDPPTDEPVRSPVAPYLCPCGEPAPPGLPGPGRRPVPCPACATPLVAPGVIPGKSFEFGLGAALLVAVAAAMIWAALCHTTGSGAPWTLAVAGVAVGAAARAAARARGGRVQLAAGIALLVFLALGEFLIYRHSLLPRLEAMYRAEGARDAEILAEQELAIIRREPERFAALEATRDLFLAMAAGIAAALWITRPRRAVAAFRTPVRAAAEPATSPAPAADAAEAAPGATSSSDPAPSTPPSSPASDGSAPPAAAPPDGS